MTLPGYLDSSICSVHVDVEPFCRPRPVFCSFQIRWTEGSSWASSACNKHARPESARQVPRVVRIYADAATCQRPMVAPTALTIKPQGCQNAKNLLQAELESRWLRRATAARYTSNQHDH